MLDTGSAVSLLQHKEAKLINTMQPSQRSSSISIGKTLPVISCVETPVQIRRHLKLSSETAVSCCSFLNLPSNTWN